MLLSAISQRRRLAGNIKKLDIGGSLVSRWLVGSQSRITPSPTLTAGLNCSSKNNYHSKK